MTITREINGEQVGIELTADERWQAYIEEEEQCDRDAVADYIDEYDEEDFKNTYGIERSEAEERLDEIGSTLRRLVDKYDMSWEFAREEALNEWAKAIKT